MMRLLNVFLIYLLLISTLPAQTPPGRLEVEIVDGNDATSNVVTGSMHPVTILVQDQAKHPVRDAAVTLWLPADGPGGAFPWTGNTYLTRETNSQGRVTFSGMKLRRIVGPYTMRVEAKKDRQLGSATLTQTAAEVPVSGHHVSKRTVIILAIVAGAAAAGIAAGLIVSGDDSSKAPGFSVSAGTPVTAAPH